MKLHHFRLLWEEVEFFLYSLSIFHFSLLGTCQIKLKWPHLRKGAATLSILHPDLRLRLFLSRCWSHPAPPSTTSAINPVDTHGTPICNFLALNVNLRLIMQSAVPLKQHLKRTECTGYKVLFLKGSHYHNKVHTISVIKQACWCHMAPHTTQQVICAVWAELEKFCNVDWWEGKKSTLFFSWNFMRWQLMMDGMSGKKRHEKLRGGW